MGGNADVKPTDLESGQAEPQGFGAKIMAVFKSSFLIILFIAIVGLESPTSKARTHTFEIAGATDDPYTRKPSETWLITVMTVGMLIFSLIMSVVKYGTGSLKVIYSKKQVLDFVPFAVCFALCNAPKMIAVNFMPADVHKVMTSMKTVFAALIFGMTGVHKYSAIQKLMLALITGIVICYIMQTNELKAVGSNATLASQANTIAQLQFKGAIVDSRILQCMRLGQKIPSQIMARAAPKEGSPLPIPGVQGVDKDNKGEPWAGCLEGGDKDNQIFIGVGLIVVHLFLHAWGSWFGETALKKGKDVPYIMQKATEMSIATVVCLIQIFLVYPWIPEDSMLGKMRDDSAFQGMEVLWYGWEGRGGAGLWIYFTVFCLRHFVSGIIVKNLDTIVKQVASNAAFMIVYFVSLWWGTLVVVSDAVMKADDKRNKFGFEYTRDITFIPASEKIDAFKIIMLVMVSMICLGWAVVSKYTKVKNTWKKQYNQLLESEKQLNAEVDPQFGEAPVADSAEVERQQLLAGEQTQLPR